jgi:hypothetical protein
MHTGTKQQLTHIKTSPSFFRLHHHHPPPQQPTTIGPTQNYKDKPIKNASSAFRFFQASSKPNNPTRFSFLPHQAPTCVVVGGGGGGDVVEHRCEFGAPSTQIEVCAFCLLEGSYYALCGERLLETCSEQKPGGYHGGS